MDLPLGQLNNMQISSTSQIQLFILLDQSATSLLFKLKLAPKSIQYPTLKNFT